MAGQPTIFNGLNPTNYNSENPVMLFLLQAVIVICMCRLIHWPLSKMKQPSVISEVIAGIVLGPSVMGHIPHFTERIFPPASIPNLNLVANIGLILFLFIVGMEVDISIVKRNYKAAMSVSIVGMVLPFALGCALATGLYNTFTDGTQSFGIFTLFVAVAISITALPVLARILSELDLIRERVGVIALSAAVGDDVAGWTLLALTIALVNASGGIVLLYVILCAVAWALILIFVVKPIYKQVVIKIDGDLNDPSIKVTTITIIIVLISSFYTDIIGVHPIFGAFLVGVMIPRDDGFTVQMTKKFEDLVSVFFLPLYFSLSGLNTNIGVLNTGTIWGYVIAIIVVAFSGKVLGCAIATKLTNNSWRVSFTVGCLMACKGLVELVVLNVGLQAGIIDQRLFSMFVLMAIVATFVTTPLTMLLYPPGKRENDGVDKEGKHVSTNTYSGDKKLAVVLNYEGLSGIFSLLHLFQNETNTSPEWTGAIEKHHVHGVHPVRKNDRLSTLFMLSDRDHEPYDPLLGIFKVFTFTNNISATGVSLYVKDEQMSNILTEKKLGFTPDMALVSWPMHHHTMDPTGASEHGHITMIKKSILLGRTNIAILADRGFGGDIEVENDNPECDEFKSGTVRSFRQVAKSKLSHNILFVYTGSDDDKYALKVLVNMASSRTLIATILDCSDANEMTRIATIESVTGDMESKAASLNEDLPLQKTETSRSFNPIEFGKRFTQRRESEEKNLRKLFKLVDVDPPQVVRGSINYVSCKDIEFYDIIPTIKKYVEDEHTDLIIVGRKPGFTFGSIIGWNMDDTTHCLGHLASILVKSDINVSVLSVKSATEQVIEVV